MIDVDAREASHTYDRVSARPQAVLTASTDVSQVHFTFLRNTGAAAGAPSVRLSTAAPAAGAAAGWQPAPSREPSTALTAAPTDTAARVGAATPRLLTDPPAAALGEGLLMPSWTVAKHSLSLQRSAQPQSNHDSLVGHTIGACTGTATLPSASPHKDSATAAPLTQAQHPSQQLELSQPAPGTQHSLQPSVTGQGQLQPGLDVRC